MMRCSMLCKVACKCGFVTLEVQHHQTSELPVQARRSRGRRSRYAWCNRLLYPSSHVLLNLK